MKFLGMPVWRKRLSDEEYVARVRKGLRVARWFRWLQAALGLGMTALAVWGLIAGVDLLSLASDDSQDQMFFFDHVWIRSSARCD